METLTCCNERTLHVPFKIPVQLPVEDFDDYLASEPQELARRLHHRRRWAVSFGNLTETLATQGAMDENTVPLYWIRLFGAITELRSVYAPTDISKDILARDPSTLTPTGQSNFRVFAIQTQLYERLTTVHRSLSEDELLYADWRRHVEGHVEQKEFALQIAGKGAKQHLKRQRSPKTLDGDQLLDRVAIHQALQRIRDRFNDSDDAVAIDIAKRTATDAMEIRRLAALLLRG